MPKFVVVGIVVGRSVFVNFPIARHWCLWDSCVRSKVDVTVVWGLSCQDLRVGIHDHSD